MFEFELILCIYIQVNHVEPEPSGVLVSVQGGEGWAGLVQGNHSCHQLLNGKPEFEVCNGLDVNK